ncbi:MAG TPA: hypothetical protein VHM20_07855, partial [Gammaproteobacteria bacterium]|nr:hypothetical protein [Gammaproteobacteria bacterium]
KEDKYIEAFVEISKLFYENPQDGELIGACVFLHERIVEGNYDFEPETAEQFMFRGIAKFYKEEYANSIHDYDKGLKLNPDCHYTMKCKAFSLMHLHDYLTAINILEAAISISPKGEYFDDIAENYSRMGDKLKAIEYNKLAVGHSPDDPRLIYNYAVQLGELGQYELAIALFSRALEIWPHYDDAKHNLAHYINKIRQ